MSLKPSEMPGDVQILMNSEITVNCHEKLCRVQAMHTPSLSLLFIFYVTYKIMGVIMTFAFYVLNSLQYIFICVCVPACTYVHHICASHMCRGLRGQGKGLKPLGLEFEEAVTLTMSVLAL